MNIPATIRNQTTVFKLLAHYLKNELPQFIQFNINTNDYTLLHFVYNYPTIDARVSDADSTVKHSIK
jgi:hypothetical protein